MTNNPPEELSSVRRESDTLGHVDIDLDAYYGAQTARAAANFQISGIAIGHHPVFIRAPAYVKKVAALANLELGDLDKAKASAIIAACDDIAGGMLADQFGLDVFQGGACTSTSGHVRSRMGMRPDRRRSHARGRSVRHGRPWRARNSIIRSPLVSTVRAKGSVSPS